MQIFHSENQNLLVPLQSLKNESTDMNAPINDMTTGSPARHILNFALPLIGGYLLQQLYLIIDAAIVGKSIGVEALAAVGSSSSIIFLILGFCNGCCCGFGIPVAQRFGAKDYTAMRAYAANAIKLSFVISVIIMLITTALCTPILRMIQTPDEIFKDAYTFLFIIFLGIPFTFFYNLLSSIIRALGDSKTPFFFLILSSVVNIIIDVILIIELKMGVEGAGIATVVSQGLAGLLCFFYMRRKIPMLTPDGQEKKWQADKVKTLLNYGVPMGLQFSITGVGIIMLQSANNALGTLYVATFTVAMRIKYFFTCVFENLGVAMATYCGQNLGARKIPRVSMGIRSATKMMFIYFLFTFAVLYPFSKELSMIFVDSGQTAILNLSEEYMRISCFFYPVLGLLTIFRYSIQGLGYSKLAMTSGVCEMVARCAVSWWLIPAVGFLGVCYADPAAWICADLFLIPTGIYIYHKLKKEYGSVL